MSVSASGRARVVTDGSLWTLVVDGLEASVVDLDDPLRLEIPYVRRIADVLTACAPDDVLHLGGGGCTLPRGGRCPGAWALAPSCWRATPRWSGARARASFVTDVRPHRRAR